MTTLYAVVDRDRNIRRKSRGQGGGLMVYDHPKTAQRQCRAGDAVIEIEVDWEREPIFIREDRL